MEIRTDLQSLNSVGSLQQGFRQINVDAKINTNDTLVRSEAPDLSLKKPEISVDKTAETQVATPEPKVASPLTNASGAIPGPSGAIISAQLQKLEKIGVQFLEKRLIPMPFLKHKKISAEEAASVLTSGNKSKISKLRVQSGKAAPMPVADFSDIGELSAFKGLGIMPAQEKDLAGFLKYAGSIGIEFKTDDAKNVGEYGAYNLLTTGWGIAGQNPKPVQLVREGVSIMTLKPGENKSPQDLKKELEETWKAIDSLKTFKEPKKYYKSLSKPCMNMSFLEKFQALDKMDKYCDRALSNYDITTTHAKDKAELHEMTDILNNQQMITAYSEPEFDPPDVELMMKKGVPDDASPTDKAEVIRDLRKQITSGPSGNYYRERQAFVRDSFKLVQKNSKDGKDFLRVSKLYLNMTDAMGISSNHSGHDYLGLFKNAKKAFGFITGQLKRQQDEAEAFIGLLKGSSVEQAKERFQFIQMPVKTEDIATRVKISHALIKTPGFEENYRIVLENTEPGQNPMELVDLMKRIRGEYKKDDFNSKKAFMDVIQTIALNGLSVSEGNEAINVLKTSLDMGMTGLRTLSAPVVNSSFQERKNLLLKLRGNYGTDKGSYRDEKEEVKYDKNAIEDYKLISSTIIKGETLQNATDRFQMVFDNLGGYSNIKEVRDAYIVITEGTKAGGSVMSSELIQKALLGGKNKDEVRKILSDGIKEAAAKSKDLSPQRNGKIVQDEEKVIIGGVKLDKQKFDNLLRILDKKGE